MPANHTPLSRANSVTSVDTTNSSQSRSQYHNNAALLGAALAFGRQPPKPRAQQKTSTVGALAAATSADHRSPSRSVSRASLVVLGGSDNVVAEKLLTRSVTGGRRSTSHSRQAANTAATLAAARAKPSVGMDPAQQQQQQGGRPAYRPAVGPKPRRYSEHEDTATIEKPTDTTPIAPTTSLVDLFEQRSRTATSGKRPEPLVFKPSKDLPMRSPKPVRSGGISSMIQLELEGRKGKQAVDTTDPVKQESAKAYRYDGQGHSSEDSFASASEDLNGGSPAPARTKTKAATPSPSHGDLLRSHNDAKRRPQTSPAPHFVAGARLIPSKQYQQMPPPRPMSAQSTGRSASSMQSHVSIPAQFNAAHPRKMTPLRTGDELANAIVASSLASSRAPSPTRLDPPPVPTRRRKGHHHKLSFSRTSSPTKTGMLHTLRKQDDDSSSESEDNSHPYSKHHKKRLVRKHPNKHHEGDRKRWRDAVTERERKRYEGVWAANKGMHLSFSREEQEFFRQQPTHQRTLDTKAGVTDSVSNITARDIWNRSRLPATVLELVWDLVDNEGNGRLCKEEFVVALWLIDQRLKGRKLPTRVSESVWASVKGFKLRSKK